MTDNSQTPDRPGVREPLHRSVHRHPRAPAHRPHRRQRERRLQAAATTSRGGATSAAPTRRCQRTAEGKTFDLLQLTSGAASRLFQLTNPGDQSANNYKGVNFQITKRMSNRWQGTVGLTLSKTDGLYGSNNARSSPTTTPNSTAGVFGQNPNDYVNADGVLLARPPGAAEGAADLRARLGHDAGRQLPVPERPAVGPRGALQRARPGRHARALRAAQRRPPRRCR